VRDPEKSTSKDLASLPTAQGSKIITVKIDSTSESDPSEAVKSLAKHSVSHLDVVIANAGDSNYAPVANVSVEDMTYLYKINTIGPLLLLQATLPMLQAASTPKFIVISSTLGSLSMGMQYPLEAVAYAASKAAVNMIMRRAYKENPWLITLPICPGWTETDMGNAGAASAGIEKAPVPLDVSVKGIMQEVSIAEVSLVHMPGFADLVLGRSGRSYR